jgi:hypothetical protein
MLVWPLWGALKGWAKARENRGGVA